MKVSLCLTVLADIGLRFSYFACYLCNRKLPELKKVTSFQSWCLYCRRSVTGRACFRIMLQATDGTSVSKVTVFGDSLQILFGSDAVTAQQMYEDALTRNPMAASLMKQSINHVLCDRRLKFNFFLRHPSPRLIGKSEVQLSDLMQEVGLGRPLIAASIVVLSTLRNEDTVMAVFQSSISSSVNRKDHHCMSSPVNRKDHHCMSSPVNRKDHHCMSSPVNRKDHHCMSSSVNRKDHHCMSSPVNRKDHHCMSSSVRDITNLQSPLSASCDKNTVLKETRTDYSNASWNSTPLSNDLFMFSSSYSNQLCGTVSQPMSGDCHVTPHDVTNSQAVYGLQVSIEDDPVNLTGIFTIADPILDALSEPWESTLGGSNSFGKPSPLNISILSLTTSVSTGFDTCNSVHTPSKYQLFTPRNLSISEDSPLLFCSLSTRGTVPYGCHGFISTTPNTSADISMPLFQTPSSHVTSLASQVTLSQTNNSLNTISGRLFHLLDSVSDDVITDTVMSPDLFTPVRDVSLDVTPVRNVSLDVTPDLL